jgi:quercetin dioxygenase-like cupin family protein
MPERDIHVERWEGDQLPQESDLRRRLASEGFDCYRWSNGPGDVYASHQHSFRKIIYVVDGTITFGFPEFRKEIRLGTGDRLDLPAGIAHHAVVGPEGVACLEAHVD